MLKRSVVLKGITPILFDRYGGNNNEQLAWKDKVYQDEGKLVFPALNLMSFLSAQNTESAPQRVMGKRWKSVAKAAQSFVIINPIDIPFSRNGKQVSVDDVKLHLAVARVKKGQLAIPNPKERPMLETPWSLSFELMLTETQDLSESVLKKLFVEGGVTVGLGTFRGVYGKFSVDKWE